MPILLGPPGLSASILVADEPVREYNPSNMDMEDHDKGLKKALASVQPKLDTDFIDINCVGYAVRYVEAISGMNFTLRFDKDPGFHHNAHHLGVKWQVDGFDTNIRHEPMEDLMPDAHWTATSSRVGTGNPERGFFWQYFKFGDLKRVDGEEYSKDEIAELSTEARDFGVIRIFVYQMRDSAAYSMQMAFNAPGALTEIPEKALKGRAVTHTVQYDVERNTTGPPPRMADAFQHPLKLPCAIFEFRYMSREGLMQEQIISRPMPSRSNMSADETRLFTPGTPTDGHNFHLTRLALRMQQARLTRGSHQGRQQFGSPAPSRHRESRLADGRVLIDLDSDSDTEMLASSNNPGRNPATTRAAPARPSPDRRVRCETVEDEEPPFGGQFRTTNVSAKRSSRKARNVFLEDSGDDSDHTMR